MALWVCSLVKAFWVFFLFMALWVLSSARPSLCMLDLFLLDLVAVYTIPRLPMSPWTYFQTSGPYCFLQSRYNTQFWHCFTWLLNDFLRKNFSLFKVHVMYSFNTCAVYHVLSHACDFVYIYIRRKLLSNIGLQVSTSIIANNSLRITMINGNRYKID